MDVCQLRALHRGYEGSGEGEKETYHRCGGDEGASVGVLHLQASN